MSNYSEILKKLCHCGENDNISYKPCENGNIIQSIPFKKALKMFRKDIEEMEIFLSEYGLEEKVIEATCKIWRKHIVIF